MFKSKLTTIVAITALVIAVFGATPLGQAAGRLVLRKNSVGAPQLKKSAVSGKKLATNAVSGAKIAKDAVTGAKVKDGTLLAADFKAVGLSGYQRANSAWTPIAQGAEVTIFVICPNGKRALGGGTETSSVDDLDVIYSGAFSDSSWAVRVASDRNYGPGNVRVWAACAYAG